MSMNKSAYSIHNNDNYKTQVNFDIETITERYLNICIEYFKYLEDNKFNISNDYYKYVVGNGINSINNIFKILLLYTKNLDLVLFHTQKSFIYYIEFITQIGDENNNFLQLNSKDASLFVYKKTIFEINNEIRREFYIKKEDITIYKDLNDIILLFKKIFDNFIHIETINNINLDTSTCKKYCNNIDIYSKLYNNVFPILKKICECLFIKNNELSINNKIELLDITCDKNINSQNFLVNLQNILKKIKKKNILYSNLKDNINNNIF